jgi:hypothetical protein
MNKTFQLLKSMIENLYILFFSKSYQHLHFVKNCEIGYVDKKVDINYNSYIFEMIISISESVKELVNKKLLI